MPNLSKLNSVLIWPFRLTQVGCCGRRGCRRACRVVTRQGRAGDHRSAPEDLTLATDALVADVRNKIHAEARRTRRCRACHTRRPSPHGAISERRCGARTLSASSAPPREQTLFFLPAGPPIARNPKAPPPCAVSRSSAPTSPAGPHGTARSRRIKPQRHTSVLPADTTR